MEVERTNERLFSLRIRSNFSSARDEKFNPAEKKYEDAKRESLTKKKKEKKILRRVKWRVFARRNVTYITRFGRGASPELKFQTAQTDAG